MHDRAIRASSASVRSSNSEMMRKRDVCRICITGFPLGREVQLTAGGLEYSGAPWCVHSQWQAASACPAASVTPDRPFSTWHTLPDFSLRGVGNATDDDRRSDQGRPRTTVQEAKMALHT